MLAARPGPGSHPTSREACAVCGVSFDVGVTRFDMVGGPARSVAIAWRRRASFTSIAKDTRRKLLEVESIASRLAWRICAGDGPSRPWRAVFVMVLMVASIGVSVQPNAPVHAASTWVVAPWGDDDAAGSSASPYRTIGQAVQSAASGDTVVLRGGVYRESVLIRNKRVHLRSQSGERAVLDGSRVIDNWDASGALWVSTGWTREFSVESPGGPVSQANAIAGRPDQVFMDEEPLAQVSSRVEVGPGSFFHDAVRDEIWVADNPVMRTVSASNLRYGFFFDRAHGSTLTGVTIRRFGTEERDMAAVRAYSDGMVLDDVVIEQNARMGLSVIGDDTVLRNSRVLANGYLGVHGHDVDGIVVERSAVLANNRAGFDDFHSAGGIKITESSGITVRDSDVSYNDGPGIWVDLDVEFVTVIGNLVEHNRRAGIEIELSANVEVLDNVVLDNGEAGIWVLESRQVRVAHNASLRNQNAIEVEEGPRREVAGIRIMNNIMGAATEGARALLDVNDWTAERSASDMGVSADFNAYWIPSDSAVDTLSRWALWPRMFVFASDLDGHRRLSGQDANSVFSTDHVNPFVRDPASMDFRGVSTLRRGDALPRSTALALGANEGERLRIGPTGPVRRHS